MLLNFTNKVRHFLRDLSRLFLFCCAYSMLCNPVLAMQRLAPVSQASLNGFDVEFASIKKTQFIVGQSLIGDVNFKPLENYTVPFAFDVQQVNYFYANGSLVEKGATIAHVEGSDVHHFLDAYQSAKDMLAITKSHYDINQQHLKNKIIRSTEWVEITKNYFDAKLNLEHMQHQIAFLNIDSNENVTLVSPKKGILKLTNAPGTRVMGDTAFDIIGLNSIRVKIEVPLAFVDTLSHFKLSQNCTLNIESYEGIADKYHQTVWASPSSNKCKLILGQTLNVTPVNNLAGFKIAKSAVFEFENTNYIALKSGDKLEFQPVELKGTHGQDYVFTANKNLAGQPALISSVSALQGMLLHLGRE
ncbi:hypothetical protein [Pseudoalteromonas sp. H105]|jgi:hypothetical protein|uniref:hypothetical protein n=1 Tax=Pseudoalteromonas sp. H105 TaxID=1348393 RepID=UPI0007322962|nr:hypothetical protein [Pseudoalteromonas sp. H105]KTF18366.1 hypothetical protein ATS75_02855 [Pseudoalteromonas sp. H105]